MNFKRLDRRYLHLLLIAVTVFPLLKPMGLPISIGVHSRTLYDYIQHLPPGSVVLNVFDWGPAQIPDAGVGAMAITQHLLSLPVKIVAFSQEVSAVMMYEYTMSRIKIPPDKKYGTDFVYFGFIAGLETALAAIAKDVHATFVKDYYGTPVEQIPMMDKIRTVKDFALVVETTNTGTHVDGFLRQWKSPYGTPIAINIGAVMVPTYLPYYPGQVLAVIAGARGGSEYELLIKQPGPGVASLDAVSTSHLLVIIFIAIGNIQYFIEKRKRREER